MPLITPNPWRLQQRDIGLDAPFPSTEVARVTDLLARCPMHKQTPLIDAKQLAERTGISSLHIKDERQRMGLGSFKALGAAYAIARAAEDGDLSGQTYATASAGNHGLSVAIGAQVFGARAVIFLAETVPEPFADRLRGIGAEVIRAGADYEESMSAAEDAARRNGWTLLSDSSWPDYTHLPGLVMEGYLQLAAEAATQIPAPPTHILLQAGVGGLAGAVAAYARRVWGDAPQIIVVEPDAAPALRDSIAAGAVVTAAGPVSAMGRLDCKTPSMIALAGLARDADAFATLSEEEAARAMPVLEAQGLATTPSGGAGLAALLAGLDFGPDAHVMAILSEEPVDG